MDPRSILARPRVFGLFRRLIGRDSARAAYVREHLRVQPGQCVLDLGCGTGDILEFLPPVRYVGYDISQDYIDRARRLFGHRAEFHCRALAEDLPVATDSFDVVIAHGLLHHLNDGDARTLFRLARRALRPGGRLVTYDGCYAHGQSAAAWFILSLDRGRHVREPASYEALARTEFEQVRSVVRHDLIRIPYSHIIMECTA